MSTTSLRRRGFDGTSTTQDYIKDGLVFHLDGSDLNTVTHKWIDRIGNMIFDMYNSTRNDAGNGAVFAKGSEGHCDGSFPYDVWGTTQGTGTTVEVVYSTESTTCGIIFDSSSQNTAIAVAVESSSIRKRRKGGNLWPLSTAEIHIASITDTTCFHNGVSVSSSGVYNSTPSVNNKVWLGRCYINNNTGNAYGPFIGTIYQIRIYNRTLTDEEILFNQAIDAKRYGVTLNQD